MKFITADNSEAPEVGGKDIDNKPTKKAAKKVLKEIDGKDKDPVA